MTRSARRNREMPCTCIVSFAKCPLKTDISLIWNCDDRFGGIYRKYFRYLLLVDTVLTATDNCDSKRDGEMDKQIEINRRRVNQDPKRLKHAMDTGGRKENNVQVLFFQEIHTSAGWMRDGSNEYAHNIRRKCNVHISFVARVRSFVRFFASSYNNAHERQILVCFTIWYRLSFSFSFHFLSLAYFFSFPLLIS